MENATGQDSGAIGTPHTPGPWAAINWTYHSTSTVVVNDASVVTGKRVIAECATEADARLIAAAPDLLEALAGALQSMESGITSLGVIRAARDALAKATGGAA